MAKVFGIYETNKCRREVPGIEQFNEVLRDVGTLQEQMTDQMNKDIYYVKKGLYVGSVDSLNTEKTQSLTVADIPKNYNVLSVQPVVTNSSGTRFTNISVRQSEVTATSSKPATRRATIDITFKNTKALSYNFFVMVAMAKES